FANLQAPISLRRHPSGASEPSISFGNLQAHDSAHIVKLKTFDASDASSPFEALLERPRLSVELFTIDNIQ
ncbi:MAG: hypothetical protein QF682_09710, partial [Candidatus Thermoplasmatota archaeon]|nr:hypothetical protein [Candidatus Thermoplasmatota archaeon]